MKNFFKKIKLGFQKETPIPVSKPPPPTREITREDLEEFDRFEQELHQYIIRYYSDPKATLKLNFENDQAAKIPPAVVFSSRFEEWKAAKTAWDRKSVIFKLFDQLFREKLKFWQLGERFILDRFADDAYNLMANILPPRAYPERFLTTLAKSLLVLGRSDEAQKKAMQALEANKQYRPAQLLLADTLYLGGDAERALELYNQIANQALGETRQSQISAINLLGFEGQLMHSPVYASLYLQEIPVTEGIWKWAEIEFYHSPHFRRHYAIELLKSGDKMRAFSKLLDLARDMPWAELAALNAMECFQHLDPDGKKQLLSTDRKWLKDHIKAKKWTLDSEVSISGLLVGS